MKPTCICSLGLAMASLVSATSLPAAPPRPNIVVILADDFGWGSAECYGATGVSTPSLNRLSREGRKFTQAYAPGSVCSPTRYGLLTGRYYWRTSIKDGEVLPGNAALHIEPNRLTLASLCKSQGYRTAGFGKWHLGLQEGVAATDWNQPLRPGPNALGFDYFYGLVANSRQGPHTFLENDQLLGRIPGESVSVSAPGDTSTTTGIEKPFVVDQIMETLTAKATGWLEANHEEPFFLYFAPNAVHGPIAPNPKFTGSPHGPYGDFIHELDWSVGQLLDTLDRLKLAENTLVIFTSDNGGVVPHSAPGAAPVAHAGLAVNGPLRGGKHTIYEGGFREPFLVRWPGHVPAATVSEQVIALPDMLATFAGILHVPLPKGAAEDSFNVLRAFTEETPGPPVRDHMILQAADATYALRQGDWKLIERVGAPTYQRRPGAKAAKPDPEAAAHDQLFNLKEDPAETRDRSAAEPARVIAMKQLLNDSRSRGFTRLAEKRPPNILIIVADDLGYGELGCQGYTRQVPTPNIDSLASGGVRFTSGYVSGPYCSPTRAGLLTGRYQQRFGHEFNPGPAERTPPTIGLPLTETTLGDRLQAAGYATGWFGKSHLGYAPPFHPLNRGFQEYFGFLGGKHDYFAATGDSANPILRGREPVERVEYTTEAFGREAASFIERHKDIPWLCYLPFNAVHSPLQATPESLERFADIADPTRRTFCAMLSSMDDAIGGVIEMLRRHGLEEETLIFFISDNGGPTESITSGNGPLRGFKSQTWEGGIRVPFLMQWKGHIPAGRIDDRPVIQLDILPTALAAAGVAIDPAWKLDGVNLLPFLTDPAQMAAPPHEALYWRFGPQMALRMGDWKLVKARGGGDLQRDGRASTESAHLYNLRTDISETENLAEKHPEKVRELAAAWNRFNSGMIEPAWLDGPAERGRARAAAAP